jgi:RimJ/RimL family protein N-acetyltransferase
VNDTQFDVGSLLLRGYTDDDFEEFAAMFGDPGIMQHADGILSAAQAATLFRSLVSGQMTASLQAWAVMDRPTQGLAGHAALKRMPDGHEKELNIVLRPRFRRKGNGTAIGKALLAVAFQDNQCAAVIGTVDKEDVAALSLARALGFLPVSLKRDGVREYILLKIMRDRWQANR